MITNYLIIISSMCYEVTYVMFRSKLGDPDCKKFATMVPVHDLKPVNFYIMDMAA